MTALLDALPTPLGTAAILRAPMLLWPVVAIDHWPEPAGLVWTAFLLGVASLFLTRYVRMPFEPLIHFANNRWSSGATFSVLIAAILEARFLAR